jgi:hypothetical protein
MDLLFSSTLPSLLVPAIPFAFFTSTMHHISSIALRGAHPPPELTLTKYFYKPHVENIKRKFEEVKALGSATAEEWIKGLEGSGKEKLADAARWEQWEVTGGLRAIKAPLHHHPETSSSHVSSVDPGMQNFSSIESNSGHSSPFTNGRPPNHDGSPAPPSNTHGKHSRSAVNATMKPPWRKICFYNLCCSLFH